MSKRSRSSRRKRRAAIGRVKREHAEAIRHRYYLTIIKKHCRCAACGRKLRRGEEMVFSKAGANGASSSSSSVTLCVHCADKDPLITYRTSLRWEQRRYNGRRQGSRQIPEANLELLGEEEGPASSAPDFTDRAASAERSSEAARMIPETQTPKVRRHEGSDEELDVRIIEGLHPAASSRPPESREAR